MIVVILQIKELSTAICNIFELNTKGQFPNNVTLCSILAPVLIEKGHEGNGKETYVGYKPNLWACVKGCRGSSFMIVDGTNEFGVTRCHKGKGCSCYCENASGFACKKRIEHKGYNLYKGGGS